MDANMDDNILEKIIKLETNYDNLKEIVEKNYKNLKNEVNVISQKQSETDVVLHKQELYQVRIESKIDSLALDIKQFREDTAKNRKIQQERLDKIEQERLEEISKPHKNWDKIKVSVLTALATGLAVGIVFYLINTIKF